MRIAIQFETTAPLGCSRSEEEIVKVRGVEREVLNRVVRVNYLSLHFLSCIIDRANSIFEISTEAYEEKNEGYFHGLNVYARQTQVLCGYAEASAMYGPEDMPLTDELTMKFCPRTRSISASGKEEWSNRR